MINKALHQLIHSFQHHATHEVIKHAAEEQGHSALAGAGLCIAGMVAASPVVALALIPWGTYKLIKSLDD